MSISVCISRWCTKAAEENRGCAEVFLHSRKSCANNFIRFCKVVLLSLSYNSVWLLRNEVDLNERHCKPQLNWTVFSLLKRCRCIACLLGLHCCRRENRSVFFILELMALAPFGFQRLKRRKIQIPEMELPLRKKQRFPKRGSPLRRNQNHPRKGYPLRRSQKHPKKGYPLKRKRRCPKKGHPLIRRKKHP